MDKLVRDAIASILTRRDDVLRLAVRQKAKFEGWLKFELASYLESYGMQSVEVESLIGYEKVPFRYFIFSQLESIQYRIKND